MIHKNVSGDGSGIPEQGSDPVGSTSMAFSPEEEAHMIAAVESLGGEAALKSSPLQCEWNNDSVFEGILAGPDNLKSVVSVVEPQQHLEHLITPESQDVLSGVVQGAPRNPRKKSKKSACSRDAAHEKAAMRQRRYRQRKKEEELNLEERFMAQRAKLIESRTENDNLKIKHTVLEKLLGFTVDAQEILVGKEKFREDVDRLMELHCSEDAVELEKDVRSRSSSPDIEISRLYADVLSSYHNTGSNQAESSTCSWNSFVLGMLNTAPLESMYPLFLSQVGKLLDEHDQSQGNADEEMSREKELIHLFDLRAKAFVSMAQDRPEIVLNHLIGGFEMDILKGNPVWNESCSLTHRSDLVKNLHLSDEQVAQIMHRWHIFLDAWDKKMRRIRDQVLNLIDDINESAHGDHMEYGSHGLNRAILMHRVFWPQHDGKNLEQASDGQVNLIIKLYIDIASILSPVQMARVCMASTNCPDLLSLLELLVSINSRSDDKALSK